MNKKFFFAALIAGASLMASAQGIKDGIDFYRIGDYENAKTILDRNINSASDKAEAYYYYGACAYQNGNLDEALSYFEKGIAANAQYPYNYVGKGSVLLKNGRKGDAESAFKQARSLSKKDDVLEIEIGRAYFAADPVSYDSKIQSCIKQARKYKKNSAASYIFEGDMSAAQQDWGNAQGKYEMALQYEENNIEATVKYADNYSHVNPELAITELREISQNQGASALVQRQLAEKLYEHGDFTEAAERYGRYTSSTINHFAKDEARYAQLLYFADKFPECLEVATKLKASLQPTDNYYAAACRMMMYSQINLGQWQEAYASGKDMATTPKGIDAFNYKDLVMYAEVLKNTGKAEEAIVYYNKAIDMNPENTALAKDLATQYAEAKQYDMALQYMNKVLNSGNTTAADQAALAQIYYKQATDQEVSADVKATAVQNGVAAIDKALAESPDNFSFLYSKSLLEMAGDTEDKGLALPTMSKTIDLMKSNNANGTYNSYLAFFYQRSVYYYVKNKNNDMAIETLKNWLAVEPNNATAADLLNQLSK